MFAMKSHPSLHYTFYLAELTRFLTCQGIYQLTNILSTPMQGQCNLLSLDVFKDDDDLKQVPQPILIFIGLMKKSNVLKIISKRAPENQNPLPGARATQG